MKKQNYRKRRKRKAMELQKKRRIAMYTLAPLIIFIISYLAYLPQTANTSRNDIIAHMNAALSLDLVLNIPHCGWHFLCWLFYACLPIQIGTAACLATGVFNALTAFVTVWLMNRFFDGKLRTVAFPTVVTLISMLVGPLYLRFFNSKYYLGQGSPNIWHNPTVNAVRPFMILVTVFTVEYWSCDEKETVKFGKRTVKKTTAYQLLLMVLLFLSTITKPSYIMVYLPVCGLVALVRLVKSRGKLFGKLIISHLYFVPSLILFLWQYLSVYIMGEKTGNSGGIEIAFFKVARLYTSSVTISLILKMAFPFLVIIIWRKVLFQNKLFQLTFWQFLMGLAITWTLAETGKRLNHGNFGWGNILAASFLWTFCVLFYAKKLWEDKDKIVGCTRLKLKYGVPGMILLWHLAAGIISMNTYFKEFQ